MFFRFLLVGGLGFVIDAGVTSLLIALGLAAPLLARIPGIMLAMTFTWLANRYFTYQVHTGRSVDEAMRYALVAGVMAGLNYSIYFLLVRYGVWPVLAVTMATACQTVVSFRSYQFLVFGEKIMFKSWMQVLQIAVPILVMLSGLISAVMSWSSRDSLWEDEIIAITHGLQPFPTFFVEVLRNDIHPFLYFLLLKLWMLPNPGSDSWALFSSLLLAIGSAAVVMYAAYRYHGRLAALWAGALFCVLPGFAASASSLRMYALAPAIAVGCWVFNREVLRTGRPALAGGLIVVQLMQVYTHAIGFFFMAFFALAALIEEWRAGRPVWRPWIIAQIVTFIGLLPVLVSALLRGTDPLPIPDLLSFLRFPAQLMLPWGFTGTTGMLLLSGVIFVFYLFFALSYRTTRIMALVIPCGALFTAILVSSLGKPMFKPPVFTANLTPFLAIGAAAGVAHVNFQALRLLAMVLTLSLAMCTWLLFGKVTGDGDFKAAAGYLKNHVRAGDVVIIPKSSIYWGMMRYAVGSAWGRPLEIMPLHDNEAWARLKIRLGPRLVELLSLNPVADNVYADGVRYIMEKNVGQDLKVAPHVWIVHCDRYRDAVNVTAPLRLDGYQRFGDDLTVSEMSPDPGGSLTLVNPAQ
ncbi:MAG: GtrA family protein [Methylococcales bacterium]|nr:GtrA family protein [Methylococcales bacterium]